MKISQLILSTGTLNIRLQATGKIPLNTDLHGRSAEFASILGKRLEVATTATTETIQARLQAAMRAVEDAFRLQADATTAAQVRLRRRIRAAPYPHLFVRRNVTKVYRHYTTNCDKVARNIL